MKKNKIDIKKAKEIFEVYGLSYKLMQPFQFRLKGEEYETIYDWYFTTGSLVRINNGNQKKLNKIFEPESLSMFIMDDLYATNK